MIALRNAHLRCFRNVTIYLELKGAAHSLRLTFDMSGGLPLAQPAVRRPLDGGVRHSGRPRHMTLAIDGTTS
jgi:hypothetical protein